MTGPLWRRLGEEEGMVTAFVVIFTLALLAMAGLVLDGGLALAAKVHAIDDAQAVADAQGFLAAAGEHGTVTVAGETVTVTVTVTQPTQILSVVGIDQLTVSGAGSATAEQGP